MGNGQLSIPDFRVSNCPLVIANWSLTIDYFLFSPSSQVILSHQCLKIRPEHAYFFSGPRDIPLMAL
jgi:hypothetical protein